MLQEYENKGGFISKWGGRVLDYGSPVIAWGGGIITHSPEGMSPGLGLMIVRMFLYVRHYDKEDREFTLRQIIVRS